MQYLSKFLESKTGTMYKLADERGLDMLKKRNKGFTLIELLAVIIVIVILFAASSTSTSISYYVRLEKARALLEITYTK